MKNTTVMDKLNLNLTQDEIEHLTTLISKGEKQRRNTHYQRKKRGSVTWEEHVEEKIRKKGKTCTIRRDHGENT
ncbi:hypothetical protein Q0O08_32060 [Bacillus thuringiensis]